MKTTMKLITMLLVICMLGVLACAPALADGEYITFNGEARPAYWRTDGNGNEISVFQMAVYRAPITITFKQEEGLCYENSYVHFIDGPSGQEEEWGKYIVCYKLEGSSSFDYVLWDKTWHGGEFELYLNRTGVYYIWLVPYTAEEMTQSWFNDTFYSWNRAPYWWIDHVSGGAYYTGVGYQLNMDGTYNTNKPISIREVIR